MKKSFNLLIGLLTLVMIGGCATGRPTTTTGTGVSLQDICKKYNVQWQFDSVTQVVLLDYKKNKAKALIGSAIVLIGDQKIILSEPVRRFKNSIYVPNDFESKIIGTFGVSQSTIGFSGDLSNLRIHTIVIDPGHGGKDPGAKGTWIGVKEKDVVLDISRRLKILLSNAGLKVIMTRDSDVFITLNDRTEIASRVNADLFVSIHANSNPTRRMQGVEVYFVKTSVKKDLDEEQRHKNERILFKTLNANNSSVVQGIVADMMYQLKVCESCKLAMRVVHNTASAVETPNRGARHARYFVVRNTLMPAILIETGFLTNRQEEKKLNSSEYRQKLAESIARSILAYASSS